MIFNVIMFVCCWPVLLIMYFVMKNEAEPKKNIILGITLPFEHLEDERVLTMLKKYQRELKCYTYILCLIPVVTFFISYFSINYTIFMIWLLLVIGGMSLPFIKYNIRLKNLKYKEQWFLPKELDKVVDLGAIVEMEKPIANKSYWVAAFLSMIPVIVEGVRTYQQEVFFTNLILLLSFALVTILGAFIGILIQRQRAELVSRKEEVNVTLSRVRKYNWAIFWQVFTWLTVIFTYFTWFVVYTEMEHMLLFIIGTMIYTVILVYLCIKTEFRMRRVQRKISVNEKLDLVADEDEYWIFGMFYYNPKDKHTMVVKRVGIGTTMNIATIWGKILTIFTAICILILPVSCVWVTMLEFTPMEVLVEDNAIVCEHLRTDYEIKLDEIKSVQLIKELPRRSKVNGTGMDNLCKGKYKIEGYGYCQVFLNPNNKAFLVIDRDGKTMVISDKTDEETKALYEEINNHLKK